MAMSIVAEVQGAAGNPQLPSRTWNDEPDFGSSSFAL
jgi:hypothetical protein